MTARSRVSRWRTWFVAASGLCVSCIVVAAAASACGLDVLGTLQPPQEGGTGGEGGADACVPRAEICGNGLDDDCNGKIDCADPACADHACVARLEGWSFAAVVNSAGGTAGVADAAVDAPELAANCPKGWTAPRELYEAPRTEDAGCACACGDASSNPCTQGGDAGEKTVQFRNDGSGACDNESHRLSLDGGCQRLDFTWNDNIDKVRGAARGVETVGCPAIATKPHVVHDGVVALCVLGDETGTCGAASQACVTKPGAAPICIVHNDDVACPPGFGGKRVLVPRFGIADQRACTCACASRASQCSNAEVTFYNDTLCVNGGDDVNFTDNCNDISGGGTPQSYRYTADPDTWACDPLQPTVPVEGGLVLPPSWTLCCPSP